MTLNDMIVSALAQLDRGHDAQTLDIWRDKFTRFANEAVVDICDAYKPTASETVRLAGKKLNVDELEHDCKRIYSITCDNIRMYFAKGPDSRSVSVTSADEDSVVRVTYRYVPREMSSPTDEPGIPDYLHGLIVCYIVGRERASGDVSTQRGANIYLQMYEAGKARVIPHLGDDESYSFVNRW